MLLLFPFLFACTNPEAVDSQDSSPELDDTGDTGDTQDTDTDTGEPDACAEPKVTFIGEGGASQDLTEFFSSGQYFTLAESGTVEVCPGEWFARVLIRANVEVVGLGTDRGETILSGGEQGTILDISGPDVTVKVSNLTLDRGAGFDPNHNSGGGGIYCAQQGVINVENVDFTRHFANDGSALYARECTLNVSDSLFSNNVSEDDGGAVTLWNSTGSFTDVQISGNTSLDGGGVALFNSTLTGTRLTVADNVATSFAAGMWVYESTVALTDSAFTGNSNSGAAYGGGLLVYGSAELTRVRFAGNTSPLGGGLFVYVNANVSGTDCIFESNTPQDIFAHDSTGTDGKGGISYTGSSSTNFACAANACVLE
ncbi:MAG: hypothetical protein ACI9VR_000818 [Cognaticolwellia sp.]|jgi:hypothetical protein